MSSMIQLNVIQGSEEWANNRLRGLNASEAPVMMGCHPNTTRGELLEAKATCNPKQFSDFVQKRILDKGHEVEAKARPILEAKIGDELYPVSGRNGKLQASFDGLTLMQETGFEHKQWNVELADSVRRQDPPAYIYWQLEHQLAVCPDLQRIILVVSDGTESNWVQMEYQAVAGRREQLLAGWDQFEKDMAEFKPTTKTVEAVGMRPDSLPALFVDVAGALTTKSNLAEFRIGAEALIGSIKTELVTDQDFADADAAIKWLSEAEGKIDNAIDSALARTGPLEELVRTLRDVQENLMRKTRLKLNKQVEAQKVNRRNQIVADAGAEFGKFLVGVNAEFSGIKIESVKPDFYLAIKGKRSFDMMVSACNDLIAKSKIETNEIAAKVRRNLATLSEHKEHDFLFPNKQQLAFMEPDHLALTIKSKIDTYKEQLAKDEAARIQRHKNTIAGIEAAAEFTDDVPLGALVATRKRLEQIQTIGMEEFAIPAMQAKETAFSKLDARITTLQQAVAAPKPAPAPQVQPPPQAVQTTTAAAPKPAQTQQVAAKPVRPSDDQIIDALAESFGVHASTAIEWLRAIDLDAASARIPT